jgi:hypothetical protein
MKREGVHIIHCAWTRQATAQVALFINNLTFFLAVVIWKLIYSDLWPIERLLINALLCNNVSINTLLRITTPMKAFNTESGNFVLLIMTKFWDSWSVSNCGGSWISRLLGWNLSSLRPWAWTPWCCFTFLKKRHPEKWKFSKIRHAKYKNRTFSVTLVLLWLDKFPQLPCCYH